MSHNLNYNELTGNHSFFSVREKAWHGLGQIVEDYPTSAEAIKFAGLDFTVEKRKLYTPDSGQFNFNNPDEWIYSQIEVPDFFANVRTDNDQVLGVVGKGYQIVQNVDAFSFFDEIVGGANDIKYETAGALGNGERIFITAKLPDYITVGRNDLIEQYLFLTTSHDGSGSINAAFTPIRIVCNNTLNAALKSQTNAVKIRHTSSAKDRLSTAHKLLGISNRMTNELGDIFNHWSKVSITDKEVKKLIQIAMAPNREVLHNLEKGKTDLLSTAYLNIVGDVYKYAMSNPTQQLDTTAGTVYGAYNAVTGYFQNVRKFQNEEDKFRSIVEGTAKLRSQTAFDLCNDFSLKGSDSLIFN
ncbi:DUF932 domain-containing protein [Pedobacter sp. WC2423]|uniref:DUF932 domain-containing protein n=1 Tax=Pedobacter sp. WC2423 TaxID=3234142 RepID=UPI0034668955